MEYEPFVRRRHMHEIKVQNHNGMTILTPPPLLSWDAGAKPQDHGPGRGRRITAAIICGRGNAAIAPGVMSPGATARPTQVRSRARFCTFFRSYLTPAPPPRLWRDAGAQPQDHGRGRGCRVMAADICGPGTAGSAPGAMSPGADARSK